ncbi:hypothetical protein [Bradyrhizobium sp. STM 3562]|uniref:hypothetical protein n=1 Tax=Bradyrhizobium sp. STM 3562 TaxID=578924 RepID=UPI00388DD9B6
MTVDVDAVARPAPAYPADRERRGPIPWLLVALVFAAAIVMRQLVPLNTDVSWLLVVAERMLDGQRLYRDMIETNPPMAAFAYLPAAWLARIFGVAPRHVVDAQLLLLAAASLFAVWRMLRLSPTLGRTKSDLLIVWAVAVLTVLPMHVFGQREHMATLAFLPALAAYALRSNREPLPLWAILIAGAGAGITLAFKPYFAVPTALCIISAAIRSRSWRVLFAPENIIAGALVSAASLGTYACYPEYFTIMYPLARDTYLSWSMPASAVLLNSATLIFAVAMALMALSQRKLDGLLLAAIMASIGFAISFVLQRRGWPYHSYPMVALAMLVMGYALLDETGPGARPHRVGTAAALILAATFWLGSRWFDTRIYVGPIEQAVAGLKLHPRLLVLSGEAAIGHPLVHDLGGTWVSRQQSLLIREWVELTRERSSVDAATDARLNDYLALERKWLIEDFKKLPPDIVLIDDLRDGWGDWARADAELSQLLKPYSSVGSVEGIEILRRTE